MFGRGRPRAGCPSVVIYDVDGLNPYGRELAQLLRSEHRRVEVLTAQDAEWRPPGTRPVLPANRSKPGVVRQGLALVRGIGGVALALVRGATVIVVLTRSVLDELALGCLGLVAPIVVVVHDPEPKQPPSSVRRRSFAWLLRTARVRVTHAGALARLVAGGATAVGHLPYLRWCRDFDAASDRADGDALLLLGQLRPDKGLDRLPGVLQHLPGFRLLICGRGEVPKDLERDLSALVELESRVSAGYIPDHAIAAALRDSGVLIAPYRQVSQSGTVALAVTAGLPVVAFDSGAISSLPGVRVVPADDFGAFASAVRAASREQHAIDLEAWEREVRQEWLDVLAAADRRRTRRSRRHR